MTCRSIWENRSGTARMCRTLRFTFSMQDISRLIPMQTKLRRWYEVSLRCGSKQQSAGQVKEKSHGNYNDDNPPPFASVHTRERDLKGAPRRRWLEHSRPGESRPGVCDRFKMEEPIGVHQ